MIYKIKLLLIHLFKDKLKNNNISEEIKIIYLYRYLSWALTSLVYLAMTPHSVMLFKLGVILSLLISSKMIMDVYIKFKENKSTLSTFVLIETVGIAFVLFPTGGLKSPFIWYALNPTLVAAIYLTTYFCWVNLLFYLFTGTIMSYILFNPKNVSMLHMIIDNGNLILIFILINIALQLLSNLTKKLKQSNIEKQQSMEQIMSLYQVMEALNNHSSKEKLFETLAVYTAKLSKSDLSFFWLISSKRNKDLIKTSKNLIELDEQKMLLHLQGLELEKNKYKEIQEIRINNEDFLAIPILSPSNYFGIIAIQKKFNTSINEKSDNIKLLEFLSELSAVILDRFNLEDIDDHLLVMEEQNRIANEIHDSVSQRLFSISYGIHGVLGRWHDISKEELKDYLIEMRTSSNLAMQELRNSIYKLSSKKKGEKSLQVTLRAFLESLRKLHNVNIDFNIEGDESQLSFSFKKGITRIIREACGNAVRHGKCLQIHLNLDINKEDINLSIVDDGIGFMIEKNGVEDQRGLGISNMKNLVNSFNGNIEIISELGEGTEIHIRIPVEGFSKEFEGGVAI